MSQRSAHIHPVDLHGIARLATDATGLVTDIVESMHETISRLPSRAPAGPSLRTGGIPGLAYSSVRTVARWIGAGLDVAMPPVTAMLGERASTPQRDAFLSVLNGIIGDHLVESCNPLAVAMQLRRHGVTMPLGRKDHPTAGLISPRVVVLIHGLCGNDRQWKRRPLDYGVALERDFDFTPVYLRYNSGLHISTNGRSLAEILKELTWAWPVPIRELLLVGHSMGGLVARSALHYGRSASHAWTRHVRRMAFLGAPHHGAPLERRGNWLEEVAGSNRFAAPIARLGRLRSAGITDLRHGNLLDEDWQDRDRFTRLGDLRRPLALPQDVDCLAIAATTGARCGDARDRLVGDGLVPVASALGHHRDDERRLAFDPSRQHVVYRAHHMDLLGHPEVYVHLARWLTD